jgi:serine/threonine protein kinase
LKDCSVCTPLQRHHGRKLSVVNRFLGVYDTGILLAEANHGSLQAYVDSNNAVMDACLRWKLSLQAAEAVAYLHEQGVIHSDLRPENYLLHATVDSCVDPSLSLDLWLCDFSGSKYEGLGLNGGYLPDDLFFDS